MYSCETIYSYEKMTKKLKPSMLNLVANCLEMWDNY